MIQGRRRTQRHSPQSWAQEGTHNVPRAGARSPLRGKAVRDAAGPDGQRGAISHSCEKSKDTEAPHVLREAAAESEEAA